MAAGCWMSGLAVTGYLIRAVNFKVMFTPKPPPQPERNALLGAWYRLNLLRVAASGGALFAAARANLTIAERIAALPAQPR